MGDSGFDPIIGALNTNLNLRQMEQNLISSNIANAETPGYRAKRLEFEQEFRRALGADDQLQPVGTNDRHIVPRMTDPIHPMVYDDPNGVESLDGNTVNRAEEMARMSQNQVLYDASVEMLRKKLGMLRYSVTDGGGGGQ